MPLWKYPIVLGLLLLLALCSAQELSANEIQPPKKPPRRSYVCPPNFIRLSHRCYFFSQEKATWQDAYFQCRDLHSNLAVIRNYNQDKLMRRFLSKRTVAPLERWLGGLYDWEQMTWKWASSGKALTYQGFSRMGFEDKERLRWHCIMMDPQLQYKWNSRSCVEPKHFICHTKIKTVTNKGKKKLLRQYNVDKYNKLNEIPVPNLPGDVNYNTTRLKDHQPKVYDINNAEFAMREQNIKRRRKARRNGRKKKTNGNGAYEYPGGRVPQESGHSYNTTYIGLPEVREVERWRRQKKKEEAGADNGGYNYSGSDKIDIEHIKWKTYLKNITLSPLHPKPIVEEFNYVKNP